jgi:PAS domain S-box-containing protein
MESQGFRHTELTFQLIVESAPNAIVLVNKEGKIAYVNNQSEILFGYSRTELIGQMVELLIPQRYHAQHPDFRNKFFAQPTVRGMGVGRELYAMRKDGTEFPIEIGLNPLVTVEGTLVLASIIDISERKKAEERFRLVVESAPNAMVLVNQDGIISLVNNQTEGLFGYGRNELIGQKIEVLIPARYRTQHPDLRKDFFSKLQNRSMGMGRDLFALRKDGTEVQVEIGLNPIETLEGQMVLASIIDITERKIQESFVTRQMQLEIKNKELEQFAYIASHDLQEPLRTVANYVQLLEEEYQAELDAVGIKYLETIHRATKRMQMLVKALLEYSRLGFNRTLAPVKIGKVIADTVTDLDTMIRASNAKVEVGFMPVLLAAETEIRQLFQNLITNAIKFSRKDVTPHVRILSEQVGDKWLFSVQDNGIGVDPSHYDRIFQIFQRLNLPEEFVGHGIGLANCKKIVELHGGEIWIESVVGQGSTFKFTLMVTRS